MAGPLMSDGDLLAKIDRDIERVGWSAVNVFADMERPSFLYTVGLTERDAPELILVGLPPSLAHDLVRCAIDHLDAGDPLEAGATLDRVIKEHVVRLGEVSDDARDEWLAIAARYYGDRPFEALQIIWPDTHGRYPDDADYDADGLPQPLLD